jgi:uncharacterized circularly permuted ATP-grasp superfamily protein
MSESVLPRHEEARPGTDPSRARPASAWDETVDPSGDARESYAALLGAVEHLTADDLATRARILADTYADQGVTFSFSGEERPFPLDLVPRIITAEEWDVVERGVAQRVKALEAFLADVYDRAEVLEDGIVPRSVVLTSAHFHRAAHGIRPPRGVRVHVSGIDLVRDEAGGFRVLEDNLRSPSGVSYVIENRAAMTRVLPDLFGSLRVRPVDGYPSRLLAALRATAPPVEDPTVVLLTPGVHNSAYFEHTLLARSMGIEMVEGRDLVVQDGVVHMRTTEGERRVDVIYRRIDDEFLDPLPFRSDSLLGCPGLLGAARAGTVTIANGVGNGVADDKLICSYVPDLVRYYLGEDPLLPNVETYRLGEPEHRSYVMAHLGELVLKPVDSSGGKGIVIGPQAERATLQRLRRDVDANPRRWIAQPVVNLSTAPTLVDGQLVPRHLDLRPFAVHDGESVWVLPGGLTRVALREGSLIVNSSQGGGSKDTWVVAPEVPSEPERGELLALFPAAVAAGPASPPAMGPWEDRDAQQQQQQQAGPVPAQGVAPC